MPRNLDRNFILFYWSPVPAGPDFIKGVFSLNPGKKTPGGRGAGLKDLKMDFAKYIEKYVITCLFFIMIK